MIVFKVVLKNIALRLCAFELSNVSSFSFKTCWEQWKHLQIFLEIDSRKMCPFICTLSPFFLLFYYRQMKKLYYLRGLLFSHADWNPISIWKFSFQESCVGSEIGHTSKLYFRQNVFVILKSWKGQSRCGKCRQIISSRYTMQGIASRKRSQSVFKIFLFSQTAKKHLESTDYAARPAETLRRCIN